MIDVEIYYLFEGKRLVGFVYEGMSYYVPEDILPGLIGIVLQWSCEYDCTLFIYLVYECDDGNENMEVIEEKNVRP